MSRAVLDRPSAGAPTAGCPAIREQLNEHLDGTLGERDDKALVAHLAGCSACRAFANTLEATIRAVRELPREHLPAAARERLLQRVLAADLREQERTS